MPPKTLIAMMGLPRSGKSTIAKQLGFPIVNPDCIRLALHGTAFIPQAEGIVWATAMIMVRYLFLMGDNTVVFDATNTTYARRDALQSEEWNTEFYEMDTSMARCITRAHDGNRQDLLPVIDKMDREYQYLLHTEKQYGEMIAP